MNDFFVEREKLNTKYNFLPPLHSVILFKKKMKTAFAFAAVVAVGESVPCDRPCDLQTEELACDTSSGECTCLSGYRKQFDPSLPCIDIDECRELFPCGDNTRCVNWSGGYRCNCVPGYGFKTEINGITECTDLDECLEGTHSCNPISSLCENTVGDYICVPFSCPGNMMRLPSGVCGCPDGYRQIPDFCEDINECTEQSPCGTNTDCINSNGGYICRCLSGYDNLHTEGGKTVCDDKDECSTGTHNCDLLMTRCENTDGSFECYPLQCSGDLIILPSGFCGCLNGYNEISNACEDIDECLTTDICNSDEVCINKPGSYHCTCPSGQIKISGKCENGICNNVATDTVWSPVVSSTFNFGKLPEYLEGKDVFLPMVLSGTVLELTCCESSPCHYFISLYHCLPCSYSMNGGYPGVLMSQGWQSTSCAPSFVHPSSSVPKPMVVYHKVLQPGFDNKFILPQATTDVPVVVVFKSSNIVDVDCPVPKGPVLPQPSICSLC